MEKSFEEQLAELVAAAQTRGVDISEIISAMELQLYALTEDGADEGEGC